MGKDKGPNPEALTLAASVADQFTALRPSIEAALGQHATDLGSKLGELPTPSFVAVIAIDGTPTIEFGYQVPWDDEHTLGLVLRNGDVELNGSVLEP